MLKPVVIALAILLVTVVVTVDCSEDEEEWKSLPASCRNALTALQSKKCTDKLVESAKTACRNASLKRRQLIMNMTCDLINRIKEEEAKRRNAN